MTNTRILIARLLAASPFAMPIEQARTHIRERRAALLVQAHEPEPDLTLPEPTPIMDAPHAFARDYWQRRIDSQSSKPPNPKRSGRHPVGGPSLGPQHTAFRVVDGDKKD